ncbi:UPF0307 protein [Quillaja saponaria]|uniref:UPF0307 protein n=1 Tax=Quillaja saponaria TaxID=32244 RepID=A0AAD7LYX2_QUISA|nr:UPF0307 protein [Quillaja saponaria]
MAHLVRILRQWPMLQHHCCDSATHYQFLFSPLLLDVAKTTSHRLSLATAPSAHRRFHFRSGGHRLNNVPVLSEFESGSSSDSDSEAKKSRNQLKREARRAVLWGMEVASFSAPQIKRILRVVSLDQEVFEALMLVKRLGPDVREGKRRQFNYIGKLLREVQPELMDKLIKATKDSNHAELQALCGSGSHALEGYDDEVAESEVEEDEESDQYIARAITWLDGLINKDIQITNEIYSIQNVEFDRQVSSIPAVCF